MLGQDVIRPDDPVINDLRPRSSQSWHPAGRSRDPVVECHRAGAAAGPGAALGLREGATDIAGVPHLVPDADRSTDVATIALAEH